MNSSQIRAIHKFQIIDKLRISFTLKLLCKIAKVSLSGYHSWKNRKTVVKDITIVDLIAKIFFQYKGKIGIKRIKMELERKYNLVVNKKKIQRIKQKQGLKTQIRKKRRHFAGYQRSEHWCIAENILNRNFTQDKTKNAYSTDVTYLSTNGGRYYLSVIKDLG